MRQELTNVGFEELTTPVDGRSRTAKELYCWFWIRMLDVLQELPVPVRLSPKCDKHSEKPALFCRSGYGSYRTKQENIPVPYPPSSPSIALFKDAKTRSWNSYIEGRSSRNDRGEPDLRRWRILREPVPQSEAGHLIWNAVIPILPDFRRKTLCLL